MFFCTQATQNLTIWMSADHNSHPNPAPQENLSAPRAPPHPGVAPCACSIPLTWCTEHPDQIVQFCGLFLQKRLCMCSECLGSNSSYDLFCSCHVLLCSAALNLECPWSCDVHVSCVVASLLQCPCLWDLGPPPPHPPQINNISRNEKASEMRVLCVCHLNMSARDPLLLGILLSAHWLQATRIKCTHA